MELRQLFTIIWKWLWLIVLGMALAGGTAYWVSYNLPPVYRASVTLMINEGRGPGNNDYTSVLTSERLAKTYAELLTKRPVLEEAARRLNLGEIEAKAIKVQPIRDTQLIEVDVEAADPVLSAQIANTVPQVFIEQSESQQEARFAGSKATLTEELERISKDISEVEQAIAQIQAQGQVADQMELVRLQSNLSQLRNSYSTLLNSYEALRLAEVQSVDTIIIAEPAEVPLKPISPLPLLNALLATALGGMLMLGVALFIEYLDDTIKSPDDVSQALGLSTLGAIARISSSRDGRRLITAAHPKSPISEAYRILRTNIQFSSFDRPLNTMLVTSADPLEGKSLTLANLGVMMAQAGLSVILVDTDLRRPVLHELFELSNAFGLTNVLLHEDPIPNRHLQQTNISNLRVLTSGPLPPNPSELLGSQRMRRLIEHLKEQADIVLFDSPPALAVTDAAVLAAQMDSTLLVIDAGNTRRETILRAKENLLKVGANILGVALNRASLKGATGYQYYYYYYSSRQSTGQGNHTRQVEQRPTLQVK